MMLQVPYRESSFNLLVTSRLMPHTLFAPSIQQYDHACLLPFAGYHAYGKEGWPRRARTINVHLNGSLTTYKTLDAFGDYARIDLETIA